MKVEILIYIYMIVCVSLMIFNTAYTVIMKRVNRNIDKFVKIYEREITGQITRINCGLGVTERHKKFLYRKLKNISQLTAFDKSLENIYTDKNKAVEEYIIEIYSVFMYLAEEYHKKDAVKAAYLPYIIGKYRLLRAKRASFIIDLMLDLLHSENVYCRENALKAIYSMADSDYVVKALKILDSGDAFHHPKLITDGLLNFSGDMHKLAEKLWESFDRFSVKMKTDILNFIRFAGMKNDSRMLELLKDEDMSDEIRFSAIRYFEKFPCPEAEKTIQRFAGDGEDYIWEYQSIAASALKSYPGDTTEKILIKNLSSPNWYVRYNSAESCEKLGLTYSDLISVFDGEDRYAREMVRYRFDHQAAEKEVTAN